MSSSLINSANAPVAIDNRHLNFERFIKLKQFITGSKLLVFQNYPFFNISSNISRGLLRFNLYRDFLTTNEDENEGLAPKIAISLRLKVA